MALRTEFLFHQPWMDCKHLKSLQLKGRIKLASTCSVGFPISKHTQLLHLAAFVMSEGKYLASYLVVVKPVKQLTSKPQEWSNLRSNWPGVCAKIFEHHTMRS